MKSLIEIAKRLLTEDLISREDKEHALKRAEERDVILTQQMYDAIQQEFSKKSNMFKHDLKRRHRLGQRFYFSGLKSKGSHISYGMAEYKSIPGGPYPLLIFTTVFGKDEVTGKQMKPKAGSKDLVKEFEALEKIAQRPGFAQKQNRRF